jgi:hypothetical protein
VKQKKFLDIHQFWVENTTKFVPTNTLIRGLLCDFQFKTFFPVSYVMNEINYSKWFCFFSWNWKTFLKWLEQKAFTLTQTCLRTLICSLQMTKQSSSSISYVCSSVGCLLETAPKLPLGIRVVLSVGYCGSPESKYPLLIYNCDYQKIKYPVLIYNHSYQTVKNSNNHPKTVGSFRKPGGSLRFLGRNNQK